MKKTNGQLSYGFVHLPSPALGSLGWTSSRCGRGFCDLRAFESIKETEGEKRKRRTRRRGEKSNIVIIYGIYFTLNTNLIFIQNDILN